MFDRVTLQVGDLGTSERFYATVLRTLEIEPVGRGEWANFALEPADEAHPVTRGLHIGFAAPSREHADAFWRAGTAAGYPDDGEPGPRPEYGPDYYGAFLLDPDGNSAEAVHHDSLPDRGIVDHLWIRVADVGAARAFYRELAPSAGWEIGSDRPERVQFRSRDKGSFSLVAGTPSEHVHLRFRGEPGEHTDPDGNTVELR